MYRITDRHSTGHKVVVGAPKLYCKKNIPGRLDTDRREPTNRALPISTMGLSQTRGRVVYRHCPPQPIMPN